MRGVAAMLEEEETDASREALREWLPPLEELRRIANLQDAYRAHGYNMVHPALLCARLHGERLGDWAPSVEVATLLVELEPFNPYLRTEALRLLSKAKLALGEHDAACDAAERAAADAANAQIWWIEMLSLRDLIRCRRLAGGAKDKEEEARSRLLKATSRLRATRKELATVLGEDLPK